MGFNLQGVACSKQYENAGLLLQDIGISKAVQSGSDNFENATSSFIVEFAICITNVGTGTIITTGSGIAIDTLQLDKISAGGKALRFMIGDTSSVYALEYFINGQVVRELVNAEGNIFNDSGMPLEIEKSAEDTSEIIFSLIGEITGTNIWEIEPDHPSIVYSVVSS
jgi:hypothetical protein